MSNTKSSLRTRIDKIKEYRCKNLIVVLESPSNVQNIGTAIRNVNALGAEKVYVVDSYKILPDDWEDMRNWKALSKTSVSAVKWSFVKRFNSTDECHAHLNNNNFKSIATSPHVKGKKCSNLEDGNFTQHKKLAIWFGSEAQGLSEQAIESCELCVNIPMYGIIESLNLGTTTGIVLYEVTKQRRKFVSMKKAGSFLTRLTSQKTR